MQQAIGQQDVPAPYKASDNNSKNEGEVIPKPGAASVSLVLAQKTIIWRKQVTPTLQSHLVVTADWPPDTAGNRLKGLQHPSRGNTYGKASEELSLIHPFGK